MSDVSSLLSLPYIQPNQAQKHVTHNEGLRALDSLVQLSVKEAGRNVPPTSMMPGDRYITGAAPTLDWAGHPKQLAVWDENYWRFFEGVEGWMAWNADQEEILVFDGAEWGPATALPEELDKLGLNTSADQTNRLAVSSDATLLTHNGTGHQVKVNKAGISDTASLLFQTNWSGRAEMGTTGSDDFEIKTSADGSTFQTSLVADSTTGEVSFPSGVTGLTLPEFGGGPFVTSDYIASKGLDLVANGTGLLDNTYNLPPSFQLDTAETPNLPASFAFEGYNQGVEETTEFLRVDPNRVYRLACYARQESIAGDWSAFPNEERHMQFMGLLAFDVDKNPITVQQHMRYHAGGVDSMTTLSAPLTPGDTDVHLVDASGWNDTSVAGYNCGLVIFEYKNSKGAKYSHYSRLLESNLFVPSGVDKVNNKVTLTSGFPASLGNPDDPSGTWPIGTRLANTSSGGVYKYSLLPGAILPQADIWYSAVNYMGGIDRSGKNVTSNFPPGTAFAKIFWLPNFSNRVGGSSTHPDTGINHRIWFSGISVVPEPLAAQQTTASGATSLKVPKVNFANSSISLVTPSLTLTAV